MACEKTFVKTLRERGMRLTPQREMVLNALHELPDHATVEEIYRRVQERSAAVDPSTVYRTLELLNDLHMLATVEGGDGQRRFALVGSHGAHVHLVCQSCGVEQIADIELFSDLAEALECRKGFALDTMHLSLPGLCKSCQEDVDRRRAV